VTIEGTATLQMEATILREVLRRYRNDWERKRSSSEVRYVYFIDAHDLDSYINPDNPDALKGFLLDAECDRGNGASSYVPELKLKNEEILRRLLFNPHTPIGLLPSHLQEMDDNIAFHAARYQSQRLKLLATAQYEYDKLRNSVGGTLVSEEKLGANASPKDKQEATNYMLRAAPALMAMLHPLTPSPRGRIDELTNRSVLVGLREFPWEEFGIEGEDAQALRQARPTEKQVEDWRHYLDLREERKRRSNRANRIDAEAIACVEALTAVLRRQGRENVQIVLVTRVMSLLKATILPEQGLELKTAEFLRHPRMLLMPGPDNTLSPDTVGRLAIALDTFQKQLLEQGREGLAADHLERARTYFLEAWHSFEKAEFALDFRAQVQQQEPEQAPRFDQAQLDRLLEWFVNDQALGEIIQEQVNASVREFGYLTYGLGQPDDLEPIEALLDHVGGRTRIRPIIAGVPGPVLFLAASLRSEPTRCDSLEDLLGRLDAKPEERYLAWALLHACRNRWALARVYARSAVDAGTLFRDDSHPLVQEAKLLLAQVRRLGAENGLDRDSNDAHTEQRYRMRFEEAMRNLQSPQMTKDTRVLQEKSAQVLELNLALGAQSARGQQLTDGIELLMSALKHSGDDLLSQARSYAQLLAYALAIQRSRLDWPKGMDPSSTVKQWHQQLVLLLGQLRQRLESDEIPRRMLAMEMIGYVLLREVSASPTTLPSLTGTTLSAAFDDQVIPQDLRYFALELHAQISRASDHIARLMANELQRVFGLKRYGEWELLFAPIGSPSVEARVLQQLASFPEVQALARQAFSLMRSCVSASPRGLDPVHRRTYATAARVFRRALDELGSSSGCAIAMFHLNMEASYARMVYALLLSHPIDRMRELRSVAQTYEELTGAFPNAAIPHFRLHGIYSRLATDAQGTEAEQYRTAAGLELERAANLLDADESMLFEPQHWIKSLVRRRRAARHFEQARKLRGRLRDGEASESLLVEYAVALRSAFTATYERFPVEIDFPPEHLNNDPFYRLERERRINNVVYSAALFLEVQPDVTRLHPHFSLEQLRELTRLLHPRGIEAIEFYRRMHTIGFAYRVLGDLQLAGEVGERLVSLVYHNGTDLTRQPDVVELMKDAMSWRRDAKPVMLSASPA
jgi:hypothetical protein